MQYLPDTAMPNALHRLREFRSFAFDSCSLPGGAWAGRVDLLRRHRFYDALVVGGGDTVFAQAATGVPINARNSARFFFTKAHLAHYEKWAKPFHDDLTALGHVGCVNALVYHLWHGEIANRQYTQRHTMLTLNAFDPQTDIFIGPSGAWQWCSNKPEMHTALRAYFQNRLED